VQDWIFFSQNLERAADVTVWCRLDCTDVVGIRAKEALGLSGSGYVALNVVSFGAVSIGLPCELLTIRWATQTSGIEKKAVNHAKVSRWRLTTLSCFWSYGI